MRPSTAREGETSRAQANSAAPKPQTHCAHQWHAVSTDLHRPATATHAHLPVHLFFSSVALRARAAGWRAEVLSHAPIYSNLHSFLFPSSLNYCARGPFDFSLFQARRKEHGKEGGAALARARGQVSRLYSGAAAPSICLWASSVARYGRARAHGRPPPALVPMDGMEPQHGQARALLPRAVAVLVMSSASPDEWTRPQCS